MSAATFPAPAPIGEADVRGRYFATSQYSNDGAAFGDTRGFSRLWDTDPTGLSKSTMMEAGWGRGTIVRMAQPAFVLTQLGPALGGPESWRPGL